jgi:Peptidase_C39 like family
MSYKPYYAAVFSASLISSYLHASSGWTWHYWFHNTSTQNADVSFVQTKVPSFTQLIFSWNAVRPRNGFWSFFVSVRNANTQHWGKWHHMADWGKNIQKTRTSKSDGTSYYAHVRLETEPSLYADGFRVKIVRSKNNLERQDPICFITISNHNKFNSEQRLPFCLQSCQIKGLCCIAQYTLDHRDKDRMCSPISAIMALSRYTKVDSPLDFANNVYDSGLDSYGSWPLTAAQMFAMGNKKITCHVTRLNSFIELHKKLMQNIPVVVSVRGKLQGASKKFPNGHLVTVTGWDNKTKEIICHDPAQFHTNNVIKRYHIKTFLRAWERSRRLVYLIDDDDKIRTAL